MAVVVVALLIATAIHLESAHAACYFPQEFQGEYVMQSTTSSSSTSIQYSTLNITDVAIPIWGNCHRRIGNNFILMINLGETSCIRCLHLKLRSKNVLQVLATSNDTISQCFIKEESSDCPSEEALANKNTAEIILFKTKDMEGYPIKEEYCPLDDSYSLQYESRQNSRHCGKDSSLDSCPSGSTLNLRFKKCTFPQEAEIKYDCMGSWDSENEEGEKYIVLSERTRAPTSKKYRCGLFKRDALTGVVNLALSRDSTCRNELENSTWGHETMVLKPKVDENWPQEVLYTPCSFPEWINGYWEHVRVEDNTLTYRDHSSFKTYTMKCAAMLDTGDKFVVFRRTQCNEDHFTCMKIQKRSSNILEFQLSVKTAQNMNDISTLCDESNFEEGSWITQGREEPNHGLACPISGEYAGKIPDSPDLCAKLWSDCRAPELMYYQVSDCDSNEIYEERKYKCLGHWREGELLYTYTQRQDIVSGTYECFVGSIIPAPSLKQQDIYIKEAGEHCQRHIDPLRYGMRLTKKSGLYSCIGHVSSSTQKPPTQPEKAKTTTHTTPQVFTRKTTKPWNIHTTSTYPATGGEDVTNNNSLNEAASSPQQTSLALLATVLLLYLTTLNLM